MNDISPIIETAKGVSEYGVLVVMGASFIVISVFMQWSIFKWFKTIIDSLIKDNACSMEELLNATKKQNEQLADIAEGLRSKTLLEVKDISKTCFDLSIEQVCRIVKRVKEENNIQDKDSTVKKIRMLLSNLHEDRNSRFDNHHYHGRALTAYTSRTWIDWVEEVVVKEVYSEKQNNGRAYTNISAVYDRIKIDFYQRLNC